MDIAEWLRGLGLERYEQAFRENEIDEKVLPGLTADDLKDLGVASIRRRLLDAITALGPADARAEPMPWAIEVPSAAPRPRGADPDLALQQKLEELRNLTQDYFDAFVNPRPRL